MKPSPTDIDKQIGARMKQLRQLRKMSAFELGGKICASQQQMSRYENGLTRISAALLYRISLVLGKPLSWFYLDIHEDIAVTYEGSADYDKPFMEEQQKVISSSWPDLTSNQRETVLKLIDSYLNK